MTPTARTLKLRLPYPPSGNHMHYLKVVRTKRGKMAPIRVLTEEARQYFQDVAAIARSSECEPFPASARLEVTLHFFMPDRRVRDLDNAEKSTFDSLKKGVAYEDDSQIDAKHVYRRGLIEGGCVEVEITEIEQEQGELFSS